jgi:hypothetical protein
MNNRIMMISIKGGLHWIRPDQIERIEALRPVGHEPQQLKIYTLSGGRYTVDTPEDVEKIMPFLLVLTTTEAAKEFCGPDSSIPF